MRPQDHTRNPSLKLYAFTPGVVSRDYFRIFVERVTYLYRPRWLMEKGRVEEGVFTSIIHGGRDADSQPQHAPPSHVCMLEVISMTNS